MITTNTRGLGDFWSTMASGVSGFFSAITGKGSSTLTVPAECLAFDAATQMQCAQYAQAVSKGQMPQASYTGWVQEQQTMATVKKYAPYALAGVGVIVLISLLKKKD